MTVIKHGGARPKQRPDDARGGPRPVSGALKNRFVLSPFQHNERGETVSEVEVSIMRCNHCGAVNWEVMRELLFTDKWRDVDKIKTGSQFLEHADDCPLCKED
jgi:hypothetical protein